MSLVDSMLAVLALAALHIFCIRLRVIRQEEHSPWLSFAGGLAVAYVFMVLLPKLSNLQVMVAQMQKESLVATSLSPQEIESVKKFLIYEVFVSALAGLVAFYGLERAVYWLKLRQKKENRANVLAIGMFGLNIAVFAAYNALIGYILVHSQIPGKLVLFLGIIAIGLHFLGINHGLWQNYQEKFDRYGRWVFVSALLLGWLLGVLTDFNQQVYIAMYSFVAGAIIMNVFNEELPSGPQARFWPFFLGVTGYSLLWLSIYRFFK
ncbi:MAG: hypothetical protein P8X65_02185 [Syntrophobacterales bacterium]